MTRSKAQRRLREELDAIKITTAELERHIVGLPSDDLLDTVTVKRLLSALQLAAAEAHAVVDRVRDRQEMQKSPRPSE